RAIGALPFKFQISKRFPVRRNNWPDGCPSCYLGRCAAICRQTPNDPHLSLRIPRLKNHKFAVRSTICRLVHKSKGQLLGVPGRAIEKPKILDISGSLGKHDSVTAAASFRICKSVATLEQTISFYAIEGTYVRLA